MPGLGKQISRDFNKTFSKKNVSGALGKVGGEIIRSGDIAGTIVGGTGAVLGGVGYLSGNPELALAGKGLGATGAVLKGSSAIGKGIQKGRRNY
jgi:hypothetical protein